MEKLKAKHIIPYLANPNNKLRAIRYEGRQVGFITGIDFEFSNEAGFLVQISYPGKLDERNRYYQGENFKPVLRPLSDLYKEIEIHGEKITPIIELAKICFNNDKDITWHSQGNSAYGRSNVYRYTFFYDGKDFDLTSTDGETEYQLQILNVFDIYSKLFELHFDIFGLIDKGLAIDINTLKNQQQ